LTLLAPKLKGDHPVLTWLTCTQESYLLGARLLLELEKDRFFEISTELYGNSKSSLFGGKISNLDLANAVSGRIAVCEMGNGTNCSTRYNAEEFGTKLEHRLRSREPQLPVRIEYSDEIAAKVVAGMSRVRVRKDARFSELELSALWNHEIETHC